MNKLDKVNSLTQSKYNNFSYYALTLIDAKWMLLTVKLNNLATLSSQKIEEMGKHCSRL